ncbi:MAG: hypothetical protein FWD61_03445 [Phycisphaerales bacterium]|nr:hypothetical protein [Phycisphaerales bacterium]
MSTRFSKESALFNKFFSADPAGRLLIADGNYQKVGVLIVGDGVGCGVGLAGERKNPA